MRKKLIIIACLVLSLLSFCACTQETTTSKTKEVTSYGVTGSYVGYCQLTVNDKNKVTKIMFDEAVLPATWAKVEESADLNITADDICEGYACSICIDDKKFDYLDGVYTNSSMKIDDLAEYIKSNAEWYITAALERNFAINNKSGATNTKATDAVGSLFKSSNGYGPTNEAWKGWAQNIQLIQTALMQKGFEFSIDNDITKSPEGDYMIGDLSTGATISNFTKFIQLACDAYSKI